MPNSTSITYTYISLQRDELRSKFVNSIVDQYPQIKINKAVDPQEKNDLVNFLRYLDKEDIHIDKKRDPRNYKDPHCIKFFSAKISIFASYLNVLKKYKDSDYLVVIQDDAYFNKSFFDDINNLINSNYMTDQAPSARLGQFLSGAIFKKNFYDLLIEKLKKTGIARPLDHTLSGLPPCEKIMQNCKQKIVWVNNFKSNVGPPPKNPSPINTSG